MKRGILYVSFHKQLKRKCDANKLISRKKCYEILGRHFLVPKIMKYDVLKEMERIGLLIFKSQRTIEVKFN